MKILKPEWIVEEKSPLISCDIHPDGSRVAVGGSSGQGGGKIQIWNMAPILSKKKAEDPKCPKLLCAMFNHMACVNAVRWTLSGKYLASGGDDRLIMIWIFAGKSKTEGIEEENWKCQHRLQGHDADVIDLAWNRNDKYLASASLDNSIIIWDADNKFSQLQRLIGHTNFVKGVTWDPVGNYLASQGADGTVRIWSTISWKEEKAVSGPFKDSMNGHVMRISWSPDGFYLLAGSAVNNGAPTGQVISRKWITTFDLVGHRKSVSCVRFAPTCRDTPPSLNMRTNRVKTPVCAVGSRDCSISVWMTSLLRPITVVHDIFDDSILDLSWDSSGLILAATSWDGAAAFLQFREDELGSQISYADMNKMLEEHYGSTAQDLRDIIIENPALIHLAQNGNKPALQDIKRGPDKQIEVKRKDGKKRITPAFVTGISASSVQPFGNPISPQKKPDKPAKISPSPVETTLSENMKKVSIEENKENISDKALEKSVESTAQVPVKVKLNKDENHVKDLMTSRLDKDNDKSTSQKSSKETTAPAPKEKPKEKIEVSLPMFNRPAKELENIEEKSRVKRGRKRKGEQEKAIEISEKNDDGKDESKKDKDHKKVRDEEVLRSRSKLPGILPNPDAIKKTLSQLNLRIFCEDGRTVIANDKAPWKSVIDGSIVALEVFQSTIILCSLEGEVVFVSSESGMRSELSEYVGQIHSFALFDNMMLLSTVHGIVHLRDLKKKIPDVQADLTTIPNPRKVWYSKRLNAINVSTERGTVLQWNPKASRWYIVHKASSFVYSRTLFNDPEISSHLEDEHRQPAFASGKHLSELLAAGYEEDMNLAIASKEPTHYKRALIQYATHISQQNMRPRLKELCDFLLGPVHQSETAWEPLVVGLSKRVLLRDLLNTIQSCIALQRLYSEYDELLDVCNEEEESEVMSE